MYAVHKTLDSHTESETVSDLLLSCVVTHTMKKWTLILMQAYKVYTLGVRDTGSKSFHCLAYLSPFVFVLWVIS